MPDVPPDFFGKYATASWERQESAEAARRVCHWRERLAEGAVEATSMMEIPTNTQKAKGRSNFIVRDPALLSET